MDRTRQRGALRAGIAGLAALTGLIFAGCGGSSYGSGNNPGGGRAAVSVFVTDGFSEDNDHVWVRIHQVELADDAGNSATVFDDADGRELDVKTLRDVSGQRFAYLGDGSVAPRSYTKARVHISPNINLIPRGAALAAAVVVENSVPRDDRGHPVLEFPLSAPPQLTGGAHDDFVVDFDLSQFQRNGDTLRPHLQQGGKNNLNNLARHDEIPLSGAIGSLSGAAPGQSFVLQRGPWQVTVQTSDQTLIFRNDGISGAALQNGQRVTVRGVYDAGQNRFVASSVRIRPAGDDANERDRVRGFVETVNPTAQTFSLRLAGARGFLPPRIAVTVAVNNDTRLLGTSGAPLVPADFFATLSAGQRVEVEGTFDAPTGVLTARTVKLEDAERAGTPGIPVQLRGRPVEANTGAQTFKVIGVAEAFGFTPRPGGVLVQVNPNTRLRTPEGAELTSDAFFTALSDAALVQVEGVLQNGGTRVVARSIRIR